MMSDRPILTPVQPCQHCGEMDALPDSYGKFLCVKCWKDDSSDVLAILHLLNQLQTDAKPLLLAIVERWQKYWVGNASVIDMPVDEEILTGALVGYAETVANKTMDKHAQILREQRKLKISRAGRNTPLPPQGGSADDPVSQH